MKIALRLRNLMVLQGLYVLFSLVLLSVVQDQAALLNCLVFAELVLLACMAVMVYKPLKEFADTLDYYTTEERSDGLIGFHSDNPLSSAAAALVQVYSSRETRRNSAEIFDKQAEITALQSQINPHFLYNTLESIRGQAILDNNDEIARMIEALSAFFRYSISGKGNLVTLRDELANINNYMLIQRYRFNNRFSLEIIIDEEDEAAYDFLIPRLIIQPLVENAVFHGLEEKLEGGKVTIEVIVTDKNLILTVSDNGTGIDRAALESLNRRIHSNSLQLEDENGNRQRNTGIALPNIHKRIRLLFGDEYGVNVYSTVGQGTDVEVTIPANYKK